MMKGLPYPDRLSFIGLDDLFETWYLTSDFSHETDDRRSKLFEILVYPYYPTLPVLGTVMLKSYIDQILPGQNSETVMVV